MSYAVYNNGMFVARHLLFVDAWLQAYLDFPLLYSIIIDSNDGHVIVVNPPLVN